MAARWFMGLAATAALIGAACAWLCAADGTGSPFSPATRFRRPVAAVFLDDDRTLCVANSRSGSLSLVDLRRKAVCAELAVGRNLSGIAAIKDRKHLLVVDDQANELIVLGYDGDRLRVQVRMPVAPYPASVAVSPDGRRATVAGLWSRRLDIFDLMPLSSGSAPRAVHSIPLPFAPRLQQVLADGSVLVADAFGGHLAVVNAAVGRLVAVHEIEGHNIRGLAARGEEILLAHQILNQRAATTRENIAGGVLMANVVRAIPAKDLLRPESNLTGARGLVHLGKVGEGAGDPAGVVNMPGDHVIVALAGVDEVAVLQADGTAHRLPVGCRPTAIAAPSRGELAVVLNTLDDSLSFLDPRTAAITGTISLGPQPALGPRERGELLFFSARLARDGWLSCHSCHTDGHSSGLLSDTMGDGAFGTPKRTLTLLNTALTDPWAWNGGQKYLHDQVRHSLEATMHAPEVRAEQITDLVSFLHSLAPPPPLEPSTADLADRAQLERGREIFHERGCHECHIPPLVYTSHGSHDVGFADERGQRKFNPPSLRGVSQGYRFLHDNRAATLDEVFSKFHHKTGSRMTVEERNDLLRFLRSL